MIFKWENLSHRPDTLRSALTEQNSGSDFDKLWVLDESKSDDTADIITKLWCLVCCLSPEHDATLVVTLHPLHRVHPLDDGGLPDVANVDGFIFKEQLKERERKSEYPLHSTLL